MIPSRFRQAHIQTGRSAVRLPDTKDLCDNPPLWRELWLQHGAELLPAWIDENPGSRPDAWWEFDAPPGLERPDDDEVSACMPRVSSTRQNSRRSPRRPRRSSSSTGVTNPVTATLSLPTTFTALRPGSVSSAGPMPRSFDSELRPDERKSQ